MQKRNERQDFGVAMVPRTLSATESSHLYDLSLPLLINFEDCDDDSSTDLTLLSGSLKYTLKNLAEDAKVKSDFEGHGASEKVARNIVNQYLAKTDVSVHSGNEVEEWKTMKSFAVKEAQRPDVYARHCKNGGDIVLIVEVHSGPGDLHFYNTVKKTAFALLSQLRYLRQRYDISKVVGFTFPKKDYPAVAVKVSVSLKLSVEGIGFVCERNALKMEKVGKEVSDAVHEIKQLLIEPIPEPFPGYPIRLTQAEISMIECILNSQKDKIRYASFQVDQQEGLGHKNEKLKQVYSGSSLILKGKNKTYKHICHELLSKFLVMSRLFSMARSDQLVTAFGYFRLGNAFFYVFPTVLRPLTYEEAKACLLPLLEGTKQALEELHSLGFAHLDVRLDNICLKLKDSKMMVVLIDFDFVQERCTSLKQNKISYLVKKSVMYKIPEYQEHSVRQPVVKFDWWQLGLMAAYCLTVHNKEQWPNYHKFQIPEEFYQDKFFKCAKKGEPSPPRECERIASYSLPIRYFT